MAEAPITPDREQQAADNVASREQSGLEPQRRDREEAEASEREPREGTPGHEDGSRGGKERGED